MDQIQEKIDPTLVGIASALARVDQSVKDLRRELMGNGQKGIIGKLEDDIENHTEEISKLNKRYWIFTGSIVAASHGLKYYLQKLGII